jgi:hypothetical protein
MVPVEDIGSSTPPSNDLLYRGMCLFPYILLLLTILCQERPRRTVAKLDYKAMHADGLQKPPTGLSPEKKKQKSYVRKKGSDKGKEEVDAESDDDGSARDTPQVHALRPEDIVFGEHGLDGDLLSLLEQIQLYDKSSVTASLVSKRSGVCTCKTFSNCRVGSLRTVATHFRVNIHHVIDGKQKLRPKKLLLWDLCPICETEADVELAMADAGWRDGINPTHWFPTVDQQSLSVLGAFHCSMLDAATLLENGIDRALLNRFRAHYLRNFASNFKFYIVRGKVNCHDRVGQRTVPNREERVANFLMAMQSCESHYRGVHSDQTCGRLRKNQVCVPFALFQDCPTYVVQPLLANISKVIEFVFLHNAGDIQSPYWDQDTLRQHFQLGPNQTFI